VVDFGNEVKLILFCAVCSLQTYKPSPQSNELAYDVHFWIGSQSTQVGLVAMMIT